MRFKIPHQKNLLCTAIALSLLPLSQVASAQQDEVEEVVVTGTFIRRSEGFTQASSVTQLSADDLQDEGTLNLGEVVMQMSFVNGPSSSTTNTIQGTSSRTQTIDLRGLGPRSTLTLLDGKRIANENVQMMIPTIAIQRMDIVVDGAAALYGNEAVAGVVNFVPYRSYDGLKVETYAEQDSRGDYDEHSAQVLWGGEIGGLDVVLATQMRNNSRLGWDERPLLAQSGLTLSSLSPGNWRVPRRDAAGNYTGAYANTPDPNCAPASARQSYQVDQVNNPYGALLNNVCWFDYGDTRSYREPTENNSYFGNATWEASDSLTLSAQGFFARQFQRSYSSTSNPGNSRINEMPAIRGELPGNPFLARNAAGLQLFGVDANGDGIPDRGTVDRNNDGLMDYIVSGTTPNGIPLREDVLIRTLRPINKTNTVHDGLSPDYDNLSDSVDYNSRWNIQADFDVPFLDGWEGQAAFSHSYRQIEYISNQNFDIEAMKQGLNCDVINDRDACYNPFFVVDPAHLTSKDVLNAVAARHTEWEEDVLQTVDIVFNGDVPLGGFELPGGAIAAAVGYQLRRESFENIPAMVELRGDTWIGGTEPEVIVTGARDIDAYFLELAIPVLDTLSVEAAVRREEFSTGQASTDPKFGITWNATDWLTLRATNGTAFIAPTQSQLFDPVSCGLSTVTDRFGPFSAFTTACAGGNPNLENETAETTSFGFDLNFGDLDFSVTYNETDFINRIVTVNGQQLMEVEFANFKAWSGFTGSGIGAANQPTEAQLRSWLASGLSDPNIIRDPNSIYELLQVNIGDINASSVNVKAFDFQANYTYSLNNWGDLRFNLQATHLDSFMYQDRPDRPITEAVGNYNFVTGTAPALPEWKANLRINWILGNHSISTTTRYVDGMTWDGPLNVFMDGFANTFRPSMADGIKPWTDMDASYTYRGLELWDGQLAFTVGSRNIFDREAQRVPDFAGVIGQLQDPMGRVIYARAQYDF